MVTITKTETEYFSFAIQDGEEIYNIPVAAAMTNKELQQFEKTNGEYLKQVEWLRSFIGDIVDELTMVMTNEIIKGWLEASRKQGASLGEFSASEE